MTNWREWQQPASLAPPLVIELSRKDLVDLSASIRFASGENAVVYVHVDRIDRAFKIKVDGLLATWSPPMGTVAP